MAGTKILIIGSSIAGVSAAEAARKQDSQAEICIVSEDQNLPYFRPRLCEVLSDPSGKDKLDLHPAAWYEERRIDLLAGQKVLKVDEAAKRVQIEYGRELEYDRLIIASGSRSFVPPIEGRDLKGVHTLWTMAQALDLSERLNHARHAVVIGGGLLGLEAAYACRQRGVHTAILELSDRLLKRQLDRKASDLFLQQVERLDIQVIRDAGEMKILPDESGEHIGSVQYGSGETIPCDLLIISTGVRPRLEMLNVDHFEINRCLVVNDRAETSVKDVYAAGDCAIMDNRWYGLWSIAKLQGATAGINAAGGDRVCHMPVPPYMVNTMETRIASAGQVTSDNDSDDVLSSQINMDEVQLTYDRRNYEDNRLLGFILLGDTKPFSLLNRQLKEEDQH